jgi:hypothetical protein
MFVFLFLADHARRERWNDYPAHQIVEVTASAITGRD